MRQVYVLHENDEWVAPLRDAFKRQGIENTFWHLGEGSFNLSELPPEGVFYNRMSASSHTRDHRFAPEYTAAVLEWLQNSGRTVVNGVRSIDLEISKARQYAALQREGVAIPETIVVHNQDAALTDHARKLGYPLIIKPNRGGKGLGVRRVDSESELEEMIASGAIEHGPDGLVLLQAWIKSADPYIIRNEFVGGSHLYSVRVATSGGFELCPADVCDADRAAIASGDSFCPTSEDASHTFDILDAFVPPDIKAYQRVLADNDIQIAAIELIVDEHGKTWTYDLNVNTNYNAEAELRAQRTNTDGAGMYAIAQWLGTLAAREAPRQRRVA